MKAFLQNIGVIPFDDIQSSNNSEVEYKPTKGGKKIEAHKNFLKGLIDEENSRLGNIENKTSQLVAQTGIIFSLLSLFVPILIDKISDVPFYFKLGLLLILVLAF